MPKPTIATLADFQFPFRRSYVRKFHVLLLPNEIRHLFDTEGVHAVRLSSLELARAIPDFGGKGSGNYSLPFHQDHFDAREDPRRFLMLSKGTHGSRGASTLVVTPDTASAILPLEERYFKWNRRSIGREREYDARFQISKYEYDLCFDDKDGYERVVAKKLRGNPSPERACAVRLGILGYLMRGTHADRMMKSIVRQTGKDMFAEPWEEGGVLILDNARVFHARFGGNDPPLKRNYCI